MRGPIDQMYRWRFGEPLDKTLAFYPSSERVAVRNRLAKLGLAVCLAGAGWGIANAVQASTSPAQEQISRTDALVGEVVEGTADGVGSALYLWGAVECAAYLGGVRRQQDKFRAAGLLPEPVAATYHENYGD